MNFIETSLESTVATMCQAYHAGIREGDTLQGCLYRLYVSIADRSYFLSNMQADYYYNSLYKNEFNKLNWEDKNAHDFIIRVIEFIITERLNFELNEPDEFRQLIEKHLANSSICT